MTELTPQDFRKEATEELFEIDSSKIEDVELEPRPSIIPEIVGTGLTIALSAGIGILETSLAGTTQFGVNFPINYTSNEIYQPVLNAILMLAPYGIHTLTHKVYNRISGNKTRIGLVDVGSSVPLSLATQNTVAQLAGKFLRGWKIGYLGKADKIYNIIKTPMGKLLFSDSGLGASWMHLIAYCIGIGTFSLQMVNRLKPIKGFDKLERLESRIYNFLSDFSSRSSFHKYAMTTTTLVAMGSPAALITGNFFYAVAPLLYTPVYAVAYSDKLLEKYADRITRGLTKIANKLSNI